MKYFLITYRGFISLSEASARSRYEAIYSLKEKGYSVEVLPSKMPVEEAFQTGHAVGNSGYILFGQRMSDEELFLLLLTGTIRNEVDSDA